MNSKPSSVSEQIIAWVEQNRRAIDNIKVGTALFFIHDFRVRRIRIGQEIANQFDDLIFVEALEPPVGH